MDETVRRALAMQIRSKVRALANELVDYEDIDEDVALLAERLLTDVDSILFSKYINDRESINDRLFAIHESQRRYVTR